MCCDTTGIGSTDRRSLTFGYVDRLDAAIRLCLIVRIVAYLTFGHIP